VRTVQDLPLLRAFAAELRSRRVGLGLNQEALAFKADLNRTFIAKLELGATSPSLTTLFKLAKALQSEPTDLVQSVTSRYVEERRIETTVKAGQNA
jgi:transcriptional regulator with XRE-family HTH domain